MATIDQSARDNYFVLAAKGKLPAKFNHWLLRNEKGETVAHVAAKVKQLPITFKYWGMKDKDGKTVAQVAYDNKTLPKDFMRMELVVVSAKPAKVKAKTVKK